MGMTLIPISMINWDYFPFHLKTFMAEQNLPSWFWETLYLPSPQIAGFVIKWNIIHFYQHVPLKDWFVSSEQLELSLVTLWSMLRLMSSVLISVLVFHWGPHLRLCFLWPGWEEIIRDFSRLLRRQSKALGGRNHLTLCLFPEVKRRDGYNTKNILLWWPVYFQLHLKPGFRFFRSKEWSQLPLVMKGTPPNALWMSCWHDPRFPAWLVSPQVIQDLELLPNFKANCILANYSASACSVLSV